MAHTVMRICFVRARANEPQEKPQEEPEIKVEVKEDVGGGNGK